MSELVTLAVAIVAGLALAEIKRWAPWLAKRIVDRAALRFDEPKRRIERESGHANVDCFQTPVSQLSYAAYTYFTAPFRAHELRHERQALRHLASASFGWAMTPQCIALVGAILALGAIGPVVAATILGIGVSVFGLALDLAYRRRRTPSRITPVRDYRDRIIRRQLGGIVVSSVGLFAILRGASVSPLAGASPTVIALVICLNVGSAVVYSSSLVDWYGIVPAVSGYVGDAPCERLDPRRWQRITSLWFLHRAAAAIVVATAIVGVPAFAAVTTHALAAQLSWAATAAALLLLLGLTYARTVTALRYAFNSPVSVGDVIRIRGADRDAYVVDVSAYFVKYRFLDEDPSAAPRFATKGNVLSLGDTASARRVASCGAPCGHAAGCRGVNWYCHRNPMGSPDRDAKSGA